MLIKQPLIGYALMILQNTLINKAVICACRFSHLPSGSQEHLLPFTVAAPVLVSGKSKLCCYAYVLLDFKNTLHRGDMDRAAAACAVQLQSNHYFTLNYY